ncbi:CLUMA_CG016505, isoform A [Clunio marinus]|uniref:CLUMA_CG016505, isoform A n=1 Tax=Clunio marinus TaxID=568069 RepID=A0A1J1IT78_9DIPT|nr:CLUMA_CG016505, isoform A [Clunio marinus]
MVNPTPNTDNLVNQNWPPFDQTTRTYLEIGKELTVKNEPNRLEELHNFQLLFALKSFMKISGNFKEY